jgi:hypothetical protein
MFYATQDAKIDAKAIECTTYPYALLYVKPKMGIYTRIITCPAHAHLHIFCLPMVVALHIFCLPIKKQSPIVHHESRRHLSG